MLHMQLGRYKLQTVIMTNLAPFCQLYNWLLFSLIIILLTDVHVYTWAWFTKDRTTVSNR